MSYVQHHSSTDLPRCWQRHRGWPNTETACDILRHGPRQESTRFSDIDRVVGLWTDRCKVHMAKLMFCGVEAAETWDLHAQGREGRARERGKPAWLSTS